MIAELLTGVLVIFGDFEYCESQTMGKYYVESKRIEICLNEDKKQIKYNIIHELGHNFWYEYLNENERNIYKLIYEASGPVDYVSEYAKKNEKEDFSETFASVYYNKETYGRIGKLKMKYVKYLIEKYQKKSH